VPCMRKGNIIADSFLVTLMHVFLEGIRRTRQPLGREAPDLPLNEARGKLMGNDGKEKTRALNQSLG